MKWLKTGTSGLSLATDIFPLGNAPRWDQREQEKANILNRKPQVPILFAYNIFVLETNASHTLLEVFYWSNISSQRWWNYSSVKSKQNSSHSHYLLALPFCLCPRAPHGCLQINTPMQILFHTSSDKGVPRCTRDYYANFWKNPHLCYAVMESPHDNVSAQRTTFEQKKPLPVSSTCLIFFLPPSFFSKHLAGHHIHQMCFKTLTEKQTTHRAISFAVTRNTLSLSEISTLYCPSTKTKIPCRMFRRPNELISGC